jgi:hypothetical protein
MWALEKLSLEALATAWGLTGIPLAVSSNATITVNSTDIGHQSWCGAPC